MLVFSIFLYIYCITFFFNFFINFIIKYKKLTRTFEMYTNGQTIVKPNRYCKILFTNVLIVASNP